MQKDDLISMARTYIWWTAPERTVSENFDRLIVQVMDMGTWEDVNRLQDFVGKQKFIEVLNAGAPGMSRRSWSFWHKRLGLQERKFHTRGRNFGGSIQV